jgi:hypothetical protein
MYENHVSAATGVYIFKNLPEGKEFKVNRQGQVTIFYTTQDNIDIMKDRRIGWLQ